MRTKIIATAFVLGFALMFAVAQERSTPTNVEESVQAEIPLVIPDKEKNRRNPVERSAETVEHGMLLYSSQCMMCHGAAGDGKGDLAQSLRMKMPDFTDPQALKRRTDGELFYILTNGHGSMPGNGGRLPEKWKWEMVHAIRAMAQEATR